MERVRTQGRKHLLFYAFFGIASFLLIMTYLSSTLIHFTTPQQFPISSFERFPLTWLIFPAELFSLAFALYFVYTLFSDKKRPEEPEKLKGRPPIAILLPVYNEPKDIVERTIKACKKVRWRGKIRIYLLDDSTKEEYIKEMRSLAKKHSCHLIRRQDRDGYKAGNINNALANHVKEPYFVILDADQAPAPEFLERTMDHFSDPKVGFVQTPQHFVDEKTPLERAAKIGTNIFYHAMCTSKSADGAMAFCGTNAVTKTEVFRKVGGFSYYTATEDLDIGIRMNDAGFRGVYVPEILVHGYAPPDFSAYKSQQYRWANGNLAILRENFIRLLMGKFSLRYVVHQFFTLGWWLIGIVTLIYILVPLLSFFFGGTHHTWLPTWVLMWIFIHVILGVSMVYVSLHNRTSEGITIRDALLEYSLITNSMFIYARAAWNALVLGKYVGFIRTSKTRSKSGLWHVKWNLLLGLVCFSFAIFAVVQGMRAADLQQFRTFVPISLWLLFYSVVLGSSVVFVGGDA